MAHNAQQVKNAYDGVLNTLKGAAYAITNIPDPVLRGSLNGRYVDLMKKLSAWFDTWWGKLEAEALTRSGAMYIAPSANTIKADAELLAHVIWAQKLWDDVSSVQPKTDKGLRIQKIMQDGRPLLEQSRLFSDGVTDLYKQLRDSLQAIVDWFGPILKWGGLILLGMWIYKKMYGQSVLAGVTEAMKPKEPKPVKLTSKQKKQQKRAEQLLRQAKRDQQDAYDMMSDLPGHGRYGYRGGGVR